MVDDLHSECIFLGVSPSPKLVHFSIYVQISLSSLGSNRLGIYRDINAANARGHPPCDVFNTR